MELQPDSGPAAHNATALLGSLLEQSVVGIYILDGTGRVAYINARFAELCGYASEEMIGRPFVDYVVDEEVEERRRTAAGVLAGEMPAPQIAGWFKRKTGERLALLTQSTLVRYEDKPALIGVAVDVTERQTATHALALANDALRAAEERSRAHASRLEVLWRIATNPTLTGDELTLAMLAETTSAIRPGFPFMGAMFRISGDEVVVEAVCETPEYAATARGVAGVQAGLRIGIAGTAVERVLELGYGTHTWDDLLAAFDTPRVQQAGWRSTIATTFESGHSTYLLWFASSDQTRSWETEDRAYVEIAASFFASHAQMRWQFGQLQYHQTHDVLTGLFNRSQFRSQARMAAVGSSCFAIIAVDVNAFAEVNKTYGNMIGDALLVEVAAGLSESTLPGEIAGRLYGNTFGVFVPEPSSHEFVRERSQHFVQRFARPFSTGDREGKEFVTLTASVGMATAPEHATDLDTLITRAGIAVAAAKAHGPGAMLAYEPRWSSLRKGSV